MADAYARLMADFSQMTSWGRGLESDLSWASAELMQVKSELERVRLIAHDNKQALYNAKAEVERLTKQNALATPRSLIASQDIKTLREQVERLTKAGDAMAEQLDGLSFDSVWDFWNAAKEGKPNA